MTEAELERTIDKYSRLLWTVAAKILDGIGNEQDAEECVADVFVDLWKDPESFDPSRGSLKTFLCLKARSKAIDRFRKLSSHMVEALDETQIPAVADPADELIDRNRIRELYEATGRLDEPEKEIIIRRFFIGQKPSQISKIMGLPVRKIENVIFRAKLRLREELGNNYD